MDKEQTACHSTDEDLKPIKQLSMKEVRNEKSW